MKLLLTIAALAVALSPSSHGASPKDINIKTSAKELTTLERILIRKFHPEIKLDQILAQENAEHSDGDISIISIQDEYSGMLEFWNLELPIFLLQLVRMGDDILLPTFHYEYGFYFCFIGVCSGFFDIYDVRSPVLKNVTTTSLHGSVNGTQLRLDFAIPDVEIQCPEYTLESKDLGQDPSIVDTVLWRGATIFIKNYTLGMSATITMGENGLELSNLDLEWDMDDLRVRYENGTHTFPDGRQEEWGAVEDPLHEQLLGYWNDEGLEEAAEESITEWLNCFLTNGRSGGSSCGTYLSEPLHRQSFAELFHAFGLAGLNNQRVSSTGN